MKSPEVPDKVPSLDAMISSTIAPMIQTTGNEVNLDTFLNTETEIRKRTAASVLSPGKIRLSLTYNKVTIYWNDLSSPSIKIQLPFFSFRKTKYCKFTYTRPKVCLEAICPILQILTWNCTCYQTVPKSPRESRTPKKTLSRHNTKRPLTTKSRPLNWTTKNLKSASSIKKAFFQDAPLWAELWFPFRKLFPKT